jgi:hypothetical protein
MSRTNDHARAVCLSIIAAWDDWADENGNERPCSDDVLKTAIFHAALLLKTRRIPADLFEPLLIAVSVVRGDPYGPEDEVPNLTYDEAFAPLRRFLGQVPGNASAPLAEVLGPIENVGSNFTYPNARPLGDLLGPDEIVCSTKPDPAETMTTEEYIDALLEGVLA